MNNKERAVMQPSQQAVAAMRLALEALDVLLTEPMAKIAADKAEALLLRAAPALREALADQHKPHEECECNTCLNYFTDKAHKKALAKQAEQSQLADASLEPVAWYSDKGGFNECGEGQPLYAAPVRTKDLTDDEIMRVIFATPKKEGANMGLLYARAVIAADREKNK